MSRIVELSYNKSKGEFPYGKIILHSGHDSNIGGLLGMLGIFPEKMPEFGSYLVFEVHKHNEERFFKVTFHKCIHDVCDFNLVGKEKRNNFARGIFTKSSCDKICERRKNVVNNINFGQGTEYYVLGKFL